MGNDAGVNAKLSVSLEAKLVQFERSLKKAGQLTEEQMAKIEARIAQGNRRLKNYGTGMGHGSKELHDLAESAGLTRMQMMELAHVTRSVFDGLAAGASPVRILAMEGGRVAQALGSGPGGVAGALGAIGGMFNPVVAGVVALVAVMGAGVLAEQDYEKSHLRLLQLFNGLGRGARVTVADIEALAEANAKAGHGTVAASEQFAQAFLAINGMTRDNLGAAIGIVEDFAKATGQDATHAAAALAKAMEDPKNGVVDLNRQTAAFTQEQIRAVQAMAEGGDKAGALKLMLEQVKSATSGTAEQLTGLGQALKSVAAGFSTAWEAAGKFFYGLVRAPSDKDQLKAIRDRLKLGIFAGTAQDRKALEKQASDLEKRIADADPKGKKAVDAQRNKDNQAWADLVGISTGKSAKRDELNAKLKMLDESLKPGGDRHGQSAKALNEEILGIKNQLKALDASQGIHASTTDTTAAHNKSSIDAVDKATADRLAAEAKLTEDLVERARLEKVAINAELDKQRDDLDAKRAEIGEAKGDRNKVAQQARLDAADHQIDLEQSLKEAAIDQALINELQKADLAIAKEIADASKSLLSAQLAAATTQAERRTISLVLLAVEKAELDRKLKEERANALNSNPGNASAINAGFDTLQGAANQLYAAKTTETTKSTAGPWEEWARAGTQSAGQVGEALQAYAVKGMDDFNNGLADAIVNGKDLGDTMKTILKGMEADLIRYLIKQAEIGAFGNGTPSSTGWASAALHLIPGFAGGTDSAPGGVALVGEHGPELVNLKRGAQVVPNSLLGSLNRQAPQAAPHMTVIHGPTFQLNSPVVTDDLLRQMSAISAAHAQRAASSAVAISKRGQSAWSNSDFLLNR